MSKKGRDRSYVNSQQLVKCATLDGTIISTTKVFTKLYPFCSRLICNAKLGEWTPKWRLTRFHSFVVDRILSTNLSSYYLSGTLLGPNFISHFVEVFVGWSQHQAAWSSDCEELQTQLCDWRPSCIWRGQVVMDTNWGQGSLQSGDAVRQVNYLPSLNIWTYASLRDGIRSSSNLCCISFAGAF